MHRSPCTRRDAARFMSSHEPPIRDMPASAQPWARPALYPRAYTWFVFLAAMDLLFTMLILHPSFGAREVNVIAAWIIQNGGFRATTYYKFGLVVAIILICETVGRVREPAGRRLAHWCVAVTAIPVTASFVQLIVAMLAGAPHVDVAR